MVLTPESMQMMDKILSRYVSSIFINLGYKSYVIWAAIDRNPPYAHEYQYSCSTILNWKKTYWVVIWTLQNSPKLIFYFLFECSKLNQRLIHVHVNIHLLKVDFSQMQLICLHAFRKWHVSQKFLYNFKLSLIQIVFFCMWK